MRIKSFKILFKKVAQLSLFPTICSLSLFACSSRVRVGSLWVLQFPPKDKNWVRLVGDCKLTIVVNVIVNV